MKLKNKAMMGLKQMAITELHYSSTNTYLIHGTKGILLFDTGWAGTFRAFCREMGEHNIPVQKISYILISHFHPDHCGIAQEIADCGPVIAVMDSQREYVHAADSVFLRDPEKEFHPIDDKKIRVVDLKDSRRFLGEMGIAGELISTPGHSDDSISLCLDNGSFLVGDLNPLYELEMHCGTAISASWEKLLGRKPKTVYYGHARTVELEDHYRQHGAGKANSTGNTQEFALVKRILRYTDKGFSAETIQMKTGVPLEWIQDVMRMYLTHSGISVQGILDRMEIRGR